MVIKRSDEHVGEDVPEVDEGWWASILSDEESDVKTAKESVVKNNGHTDYADVDWGRVQEIFEHDEVVTLDVQGYNRGGLLVQGDGIQGFVPVSHLVEMPAGMEEEERKHILSDYVGKKIDLKVIECEPAQERIVLSERAAMAGEGRRKQLFESLTSGSRTRGVVTNVTDFGVFVDLGGVEGLVHVSELSWGRVQHPADILDVGQEVETLVLNVSEESSRVALSIKRLYPNPWDELTDHYHPGDVVPATITAIMRFGAFARLNEGVEGLIHVSSISFPHGIKEIDSMVHEGEQVSVRILHIDADRRRLGLGLVSD